MTGTTKLDEFFTKGAVSAAIGRGVERFGAKVKRNLGNGGHLDAINWQQRLVKEFMTYFDKKLAGGKSTGFSRKNFNMRTALMFWTHRHGWFPERPEIIAQFCQKHFKAVKQQPQQPQPEQQQPVSENAFASAARRLAEQDFERAAKLLVQDEFVVAAATLMEEEAISPAEQEKHRQGAWIKFINELPSKELTRAQLDELAMIVFQDMYDQGMISEPGEAEQDGGTAAQPMQAAAEDMVEFNDKESMSKRGTSIDIYVVVRNLKGYGGLESLYRLAKIGKQHHQIDKIANALAADTFLREKWLGIFCAIAMGFSLKGENQNSRRKGTNGEWFACRQLDRILPSMNFSEEELQEFDKIGESSDLHHEVVRGMKSSAILLTQRQRALLACFAKIVQTPNPMPKDQEEDQPAPADQGGV